MIKTIDGRNQQICITIVKDGKTLMNMTSNDSTGYVDMDRCNNVTTNYDESRRMMMVRIEV